MGIVLDIKGYVVCLSYSATASPQLLIFFIFFRSSVFTFLSHFVKWHLMELFYPGFPDANGSQHVRLGHMEIFSGPLFCSKMIELWSLAPLLHLVCFSAHISKRF